MRAVVECEYLRALYAPGAGTAEARHRRACGWRAAACARAAACRSAGAHNAIPLFAGNRDRSGSESSTSQRRVMLNEKMKKFLSVRGRFWENMRCTCTILLDLRCLSIRIVLERKFLITSSSDQPTVMAV